MPVYECIICERHYLHSIRKRKLKSKLRMRGKVTVLKALQTMQIETKDGDLCDECFLKVEQCYRKHKSSLRHPVLAKKRKLEEACESPVPCVSPTPSHEHPLSGVSMLPSSTTMPREPAFPPSSPMPSSSTLFRFSPRPSGSTLLRSSPMPGVSTLPCSSPIPTRCALPCVSPIAAGYTLPSVFTFPSVPRDPCGTTSMELSASSQGNNQFQCDDFTDYAAMKAIESADIDGNISKQHPGQTIRGARHITAQDSGAHSSKKNEKKNKTEAEELDNIGSKLGFREAL